MKNPFRTLLLIILLSSLLAGCRLPFSSGSTEDKPGQVLFQDDFSEPRSGWNRVTQADGVSNYDDGAYRILVNAPNTDIWARPELGFKDVRIEVDVYKAGGERNNRFGVLCRLNLENRFYVFLISSDGYYGIGKVDGDQYSLLGAAAMQPSDKIKQGTALNHLRADCNGNRLALWINHEKVYEVQDDTYTQGDVGLIAGTYDVPGTDVHFDNFTVLKPEASDKK